MGMNAETLAESVGSLRQAVQFIEARLGESLDSPNRQQWLDALPKKRLLLHNLEEFAAFLSPDPDPVFPHSQPASRVTQT
jgi:hypothetical protein